MENTELRNMVPLVRVVKASIIDVWGDIGHLQERYSHWAARGMEKLQRESLRYHNRKRVLLHVSRNTLTATLPPDFESILFVGYIDDNGRKIELRRDSRMVNETIVHDLAPELCSNCGCDKGACEDLFISEGVNLIPIDDKLYEETVTKKLYPNGDYYEERNTPSKNLTTGIITMIPSKQFIVNFDLKDCGCLDDSEDNMCKLNEYCPSVYATYFAPCDSCCDSTDYGSIEVYEEEGVIGFDPQYPFDNVYIEYVGFLPKIKGQYAVPKVAFEALVNFTKFKSVENKKGVSGQDRMWYWSRYIIERENMDRIIHRFSLAKLLELATRIPKFDVESGNDSWYDCYHNNNNMMKKCRPRRSNDCGENQPQVINTITKITTVTNEIVHRKIKFMTGDAQAVDGQGNIINFVVPLQEGENQLIINDEDVIENSVNVMLNTNPMEENDGDTASYTVVYGLNGIEINFTQAASIDDKYTITYTKNVNA